MAGSLTQWAEQNLLTHIFRTASWTKPTGCAIALLTSVPVLNNIGGNLGGFEPANANGYARQSTPNLDANWAAITFTNGSGTTSNVNTITFGPCTTTAWGWISGVAITDSTLYASGNPIMFGYVTTPKLIGVGDSFQFTAGNLAIFDD
jgi:hypothetical protein